MPPGSVTTRSERTDHQSYGRGWVVAQFIVLLVTAVAPAAGPQFLASGSWRIWVALLFGVPGVVMVGLGVKTLGSSLTPLPRPRTEGRLVTEGIYGMVRHPIYGGLMLMGFGWAVWRGSLLHLVLAVVIALFFGVKARHEEVLMTGRFPDYALYRSRTRRFIPWLY